MSMKIGVLGDNESVIGYKAIGLQAVACTSRESGIQKLNEMAKECGIIYVIEDTAEMIMDEIRKYDNEKLPAIILIPGNRGSLGIGMENLNKAVEKAVGSNILNGQ